MASEWQVLAGCLTFVSMFHVSFETEQFKGATSKRNRHFRLKCLAICSSSKCPWNTTKHRMLNILICVRRCVCVGVCVLTGLYWIVCRLSGANLYVDLFLDWSINKVWLIALLIHIPHTHHSHTHTQVLLQTDIADKKKQKKPQLKHLIKLYYAKTCTHWHTYTIICIRVTRRDNRWLLVTIATGRW